MATKRTTGKRTDTWSGRTRQQRGTKGERGERGPRGPRGLGGVSPAVVEALHEDMQKMRADADIQLRRIGQLQAQLDVALKELARLRNK